MVLPDFADIDTYGGRLRNYGEVADPSTDLDADAFNECRADVGGLTMTGARAMHRFKGHASTPADPDSGFIHAAVWGAGPEVKPTPTKGGTGIYVDTWPDEITDPLGTTRTVNLRVARAWVEINGSTRYSAEARVTSANVVEVRVFTNGGSLDDAAGLNIVVMAW